MAQKPLLVADGIPMPIVRLNRIVLVGGIAAAIVFNAPWITTILFAMILPAVLFGRRASPIYAIGKLLLANQLAGAEHEDQQLMRFNSCWAQRRGLFCSAQIRLASCSPAWSAPLRWWRCWASASAASSICSSS